MANLVAALARQLVLLLLVTAGGDAEGVRTPVFRGAMSLSGRAIALFEVQGNAGTWQGEVGRTLPNSSWRIERIDLANGLVAVRVGGRTPVTLAVGDTYAFDRVMKGADPARAPAPMTREESGAGFALRPGAGTGPGGQAAMEAQLMRQLADPRMQQQLKALGIPLGQLGLGQPAAQNGAAQAPAAQMSAARATPHADVAALPPPVSVSAVPLVRAVDASVTVPRISSLGKPGYQTVVMLMSSAHAESRALKPRVLGLTRRPRTAVVFVDMGEREDAPVRSAWNAPALPHFMLIDAGGGVLGSGESARRVVDSWLGQNK